MAEAQRPSPAVQGAVTATVSSANGGSDGCATVGVSTIKRYHDDAFAKISKALDFDEQGNLEKAAHYYGLAVQALSIGLDADDSAHSNEARSMQKKMRKSLVQIKQRLEDLERSFSRQPSAPPLKPDRSSGRSHGQSTISSSEIEAMEAMASLGDSIMASEGDDSPPSYAESEANADQVLGVEGVQIYFINSAGHVSAPSSPSSLRIYKFRGDRRQDAAGRPPAFLQVSDWLYPLLPGQSPALKSADGSYIFPDLNASESHCYVGLILSPDVSSSKRTALEASLKAFAALQVLPGPETRDATSPTSTSTRAPPPRPPPPQTRLKTAEMSVPEKKDVEEEEELPTWSTTISKGIVKGTEWVSWGVSKGAEYSGKLISKGTTKLRDNIKPDENPKQVDPKYQKSLYYAKEATSVAVKVSNVLVSSLHYLAKRTAEELAPVIKKQGEKLFPDQTDGERKKTIDGVSHVALSGLKGFGLVYRELEMAAKTLASSISNATVETVQHKYGDEAASATENGLHTVGNIGLTAYNIDNIGMKALAKHTAKNTGITLLDSSQKDVTSNPTESNP